MAKLLRLRRGTTTQHASFTGAEGEVTIDTTKDTAVVHDGSQAGGRPLLREDMSNLPAGTIDNADINASAAIAGTKISPDFGSQNVTTTGTISTGSGSDQLNITHSGGGASTVAATGDLVLKGTDNVYIGGVNNETHIKCTENGSVELNHDNTKKAQTYSDGFDVIGNISVSGTVDGVDVATRDTLFGGLTSSSGVLTDGVTATTQAQSDDSTKVSTTAYVRTAITEAKPFPSGTKMLFQQTSAPTGWTKVTSGVDNKALRVVSGTAGSGGSNAFSNTLADRGITANAANTTQGGNVSVSVGNTTAGGNVSIGDTAQSGNVSVSIGNTSVGGNVNSHTLSTSQMPSHNHSGGFNPGNGDDVPQGSPDRKGNNTPTGSTGGSGGHSHGFSGSSHTHNANANFSGSNHNHNATFSGTEHSHNATGSFTGSAHNHSISVGNLDLAVSYLDVIIAQKD